MMANVLLLLLLLLLLLIAIVQHDSYCIFASSFIQHYAAIFCISLALLFTGIAVVLQRGKLLLQQH